VDCGNETDRKRDTRFVESEFAQLIALFAAWRQDIDSEPFAHEAEWATVDSPAFRVVAGWVPRQQPRTRPSGSG
jgi:hypothetical protein